jgi:hypothetical protein
MIYLIAVLVLLWAGSQYWLAPIVVRMTHRLTPHVTDLRPVAESDTEPACRSVLEQYRGALEPLGFVRMPVLVNKGPGPQGYVQLYEHREHGDVATVLALPDPAQPQPQNLVVFTAIVGGERHRTVNSPLPSTFPTPRGTRVARFPEERDPARLYALHRAWVKRRGQRQQPMRIGDPVAYQRRDEAEGPRHWVTTGYAFWDGAELRPTWKGAVCMPWRMLFPWKHLNEWRDEALRRRLLPEAGLA